MPELNDEKTSINEITSRDPSEEFVTEDVSGMKPLWLTFNQVCQLLGLERNGLRSLIRREKGHFPECYKLGTSRQASVFFDRVEIESWYRDFKKRYRDKNEKIQKIKEGD